MADTRLKNPPGTPQQPAILRKIIDSHKKSKKITGKRGGRAAPKIIFLLTFENANIILQ
jgi:hypothetical protein